MKKQILSAAVIAALGGALPLAAHAAVLNTGDTLTITGPLTKTVTTSSGAHLTKITGGSWFGMNTNTNPGIQVSEKDGLSQGTQGLIIGETQAAGGICTNGVCSYTGAPLAGDTSNINAPWEFGGNTGKNYTVVAPTGGTTNGINLSGWTVTWGGGVIDMGTGAWNPTAGADAGQTFTNSVANFTWDGTYGDSYTLNYTATVPTGAFAGVQYMLHLTGNVVKPTPIPAAAWLFGSGLIGLVGVARRKKST